MKDAVRRFIVTGVAVLVASQMVPGVVVKSVESGMFGVLVLVLLHALVRPFLYLLSAPFILVTLGLFMIVINALLLLVVSSFVEGFHVAGFWPAVWCAMLISLVSWVVSTVVSGRGHVDMATPPVRSRRVRHIN